MYKCKACGLVQSESELREVVLFNSTDIGCKVCGGAVAAYVGPLPKPKLTREMLEEAIKKSALDPRSIPGGIITATKTGDAISFTPAITFTGSDDPAEIDRLTKGIQQHLDQRTVILGVDLAADNHRDVSVLRAFYPAWVAQEHAKIITEALEAHQQYLDQSDNTLDELAKFIVDVVR